MSFARAVFLALNAPHFIPDKVRVSGPRGGLYIVCQGLLDGRLLDGHLGAYYILTSFFLNIQEFKNQFSNINTGGYDI